MLSSSPSQHEEHQLTLSQKFEFTPEGIAKRAKLTVDFYKDVKPLRSPLNRAFQNLV